MPYRNSPRTMTGIAARACVRRASPTPASPSTNAESSSCPESRAILWLHGLEGLVNPLLYACRFPVQVAQLAKALHPVGLAGASRATPGVELFLQGLAHELLERLAALGGFRLGPAEESVRNLDGRLHRPILPYLREVADPLEHRELLQRPAS